MDNMYFSAELMGGVGNQMFQIAHAVAQSYRYGTKAIFRPHSSTHMQGRNTGVYVTNIFRKINFDSQLSPKKIINEPDWSFNRLDVEEMIPTSFYGYFQSSKNFYNFNQEIKNLFEPDEDTLDFFYEKYPQIKQSDTLSIHIRRGDSFMNPDIHPMVTKEYINKSLYLFSNINHIFVFTDDKEWAKQNLQLSNCTFVDEDEDYKELWLMSLCQNNIISNSTFSWWSSFLNKNKQKKVVAPSMWFGPRGPQNYRDIYESNWSVINVKYNNGFLN